MRTTVDIDAHLLRRLRSEAHRTGASFKDVLSRVLRRGLDAAAGAAPGSKYQCPSFSMGRAAPTTLDKALRMAAALEDEEVAREMVLRK